MSMTWRSKSASTVSARVDLKAWINSGGRSWMKPIVSEMRTSWPGWYWPSSRAAAGMYNLPMRVSRVAKSSLAE